MSDTTSLPVDAFGASLGSKTTVAGAGAGIIGWASQLDWLGLSGVFFAVIGLLINLYFQVRRDRRETAESEARMQALKEKEQDDDHGQS